MNTRNASGKTEHTGCASAEGLALAWRIEHREAGRRSGSRNATPGGCMTAGSPAETAATWSPAVPRTMHEAVAVGEPRKVRLQDRRAGRWMAAYIALAWVTLEVVSLLGDIWSWPQLCQQLASVVLGAGTFPAAVVAWYHGERGRQSVSGEELALLAASIMGLVFTVWAVCFARLA